MCIACGASFPVGLRQAVNNSDSDISPCTCLIENSRHIFILNLRVYTLETRQWKQIMIVQQSKSNFTFDLGSVRNRIRDSRVIDI